MAFFTHKEKVGGLRRKVGTKKREERKKNTRRTTRRGMQTGRERAQRMNAP